MKLELTRIFTCKDYTIGKLFINGEYFCETCEDTDRGLDDSMTEDYIRSQKVYSKTAIPLGVYKVSMDIKSPKYGKIMPRLMNVKGFEGILIHAGNTADDSMGCILVGQNKIKGKVINSRKTFNKLMEILNNSKDEDIYIYIDKRY